MVALDETHACHLLPFVLQRKALAPFVLSHIYSDDCRLMSSDNHHTCCLTPHIVTYGINMQSLTSYYKEKADLRDDKRRLKALQSQPTPQLYSSTTQNLASLATEHYDQLATKLLKPLSNFPTSSHHLQLIFLPSSQACLHPATQTRRSSARLPTTLRSSLSQSSVSEEQFISFLNRLNVAIGFDNRIKILNFAIDIATIACSTWEVVVATVAAQALSTTAAHVKSRSKSEAYVAHANERFWHPRGLHAQIVLLSGWILHVLTQLTATLTTATQMTLQMCMQTRRAAFSSPQAPLTFFPFFIQKRKVVFST